MNALYALQNEVSGLRSVLAHRNRELYQAKQQLDELASQSTKERLFFTDKYNDVIKQSKTSKDNLLAEVRVINEKLSQAEEELTEAGKKEQELIMENSKLKKINEDLINLAEDAAKTAVDMEVRWLATKEKLKNLENKIIKENEGKAQVMVEDRAQHEECARKLEAANTTLQQLSDELDQSEQALDNYRQKVEEDVLYIQQAIGSDVNATLCAPTLGSVGVREVALLLEIKAAATSPTIEGTNLVARYNAFGRRFVDISEACTKRVHQVISFVKSQGEPTITPKRGKNSGQRRRQQPYHNKKQK